MIQKERKFTIEEMTRALGNDTERVAFTLSEMAQMFGLEKRRLRALLERKGVPMFWVGNRRMIKAEVLQAILDGTIDVGTPPERTRDVDGLFAPDDNGDNNAQR